MSKDLVRTSDLEKMRTEIRGEIATWFDMSFGERIVQKILDRASERTANIQKAAAVATAEGDEAEKQTRLSHERHTRLKQEIGELAKERGDLQTALATLQADYDALVPKVAELRKEYQSHIDSVRKLVS